MRNVVSGGCGRPMWIGLLALACVLDAGQAVHAQPSNADKQAIGFTDLQALLGVNMPTGSGITVAQVEALQSGNYRPNANDTQLDNRTYIFESGGSAAASSHATKVGRYFYGDLSLAPGISTIHSFEANNWLGIGELNVGQNALPDSATGRVQNHSWIGSYNDDALNIEALRRLDLMIDRDNTVVVVGVNNGSNTTVPKLLAQSYNSIAVGITNGNSSLGPATLDVAGRRKPDIVAPASATSWGTPLVSGAAALLLNTADGLGGNAADAGQAQTIKAALLAGATKDEFNSWSRTTTQPLDNRFGAGELNVFNSHGILSAGQQEASITQPVARTGWDYDNVAANGSKTYFFEIAANEILEELSVIATWHREVTDTDNGPGVALAATLANIDLRLFAASGFVLGSTLDSSLSTVDNVEHLYQTNLGPGQYAIQLSSDLAWDFGLAWRSTITVIPEPGTGVLVCVLSLVGLRRRHVRGTCGR